MSIADKLKTIAENEQKVFNSGYDKGVSDILDSYPLAVNGTFVPNEDTNTFEMSGLTFTPTAISIICSSEVGSSNRKPDTFICGVIPKGLYGNMLYTDANGANRLGSVKPTSTILQWAEDGVSVTLPSTSSMYFKAGLVYNYYITGGVE